MDKQEIKQNIIAAAFELNEFGVKELDVYIGGSSTISLLSSFPRQTLDIDIVSSLRNNEIRKILMKFDINDHLATSVDPNLREQYGYYEETSDLFYESKGIRFFVVWPEVVLLGKAFHMDRPKDIVDVKNLTGKLDKKRLDIACESVTKYMKKDSPFDPFINEVISARDLLKGKQNEKTII